MRSENIAASLPSRHFRPRVYCVGAWTAHIHFAYDLVARLRPRVFVELGTDRGESYFAICQASAENKTGTTCFAVDTWRGDLHAGQYDETTFALVAAHNRAYYKNFSKLMRCTFDAALENFPLEGIDLLHLDGLHSEEAVRRDLGNWLPKLRAGGLLLLHDIHVRTREFGVWKVWDELIARGRSWGFDEGPGLGVWQSLLTSHCRNRSRLCFRAQQRIASLYSSTTGPAPLNSTKKWRNSGATRRFVICHSCSKL